MAPSITKENMALYNAAVNEGKPAVQAATPTPTGANEPPRSDAPSTAPAALSAPDAGSNGIGVSIVNAPSGASGGTPSGNSPAADPNAVIKAVGPESTAIPAAEAPAPAPNQVNDIKNPAPASNTADSKKKKPPKADLSDESSSKKKKKKGLGKLNPF